MKRVQSITQKAFEKFGIVIEFTEDFQEQFQILVKEKEQPWRIAMFRYNNKSVKVMENHPTSMETFEPVAGITVLIVAENNKPEDYEVFILDKPVCLHKGIWHQVISLTDEAQVKITENLEVNSNFYEFETPLEIVAVHQ